MEELAHDLIETKKKNEIAKHGFAFGHGRVEQALASEPHHQESAGKAKMSSQDPENHSGVLEPTTNASATEPGCHPGGGKCPEDDRNPLARSRTHEGLLESATEVAPGMTESKLVIDTETRLAVGKQPAVHGSVESGANMPFDSTLGETQPSGDRSKQPLSLSDTYQRVGKPERDTRIESPLAILPDSLVDEINARAFPVADGILCEAFHALAAEAVLAGLRGSKRVQKPPESVWRARGGDRWGVAAFFAERINDRGDRGEDVVACPPSSAPRLGDNGSDGPDNAPLSGPSARHASARRQRLAAMSSRREFLKQANDAATEEVLLLLNLPRVPRAQIRSRAFFPPNTP